MTGAGAGPAGALRRLGRALLRHVDDGHGWIWAFGPLGVPPGFPVRMMQRRCAEPGPRGGVPGQRRVLVVTRP